MKIKMGVAINDIDLSKSFRTSLDRSLKATGVE
jgi:hypothetical protein